MGGKFCSYACGINPWLVLHKQFSSRFLIIHKITVLIKYDRVNFVCLENCFSPFSLVSLMLHKMTRHSLADLWHGILYSRIPVRIKGFFFNSIWVHYFIFRRDGSIVWPHGIKHYAVKIACEKDSSEKPTRNSCYPSCRISHCAPCVCCLCSEV